MKFFRFKICIFGDGGVGKTTLINRYISGRFSDSFKMTIGVEFYIKNLEFNNLRVQLQIWDFAGEQQFKNLLPNYIIGASGGLYMYDISRFSSLKNLDDWLKIAKKSPDAQTQYMPILLVGGKLDLESVGKRSIEREYAYEYGKKYNLFELIECSSKTGKNIDLVFETLTQKMISLSSPVV